MKILSFIFSIIYLLPFGRKITQIIFIASQVSEPGDTEKRAALIELVQTKGIAEKNKKVVLGLIWGMRPK